jgi:signal transduction histidine kinase
MSRSQQESDAELSHKQELLRILRERQRNRELQAAQYGINVPPEIKSELVALSDQIHIQATEIARLEGLSSPSEPLSVGAGDQSISRAGNLPCPYPGMIPFRAEDARFFYGREAEIQRMLQHLRYHRMLFVIGPSGSGKSSLIHAGLLQRLQRSRFFPQGHWIARTIRPGAQPVYAMAQALAGDLGHPERAVADLLAAHPGTQRLLLVIDQFEELFTQVDREGRLPFFELLQAIRTLEQCALLIVMRADFYADLMNSHLWPIPAGQRIELAPLRGTYLRQALERPAREMGVHLEAGLLERLLADAADEPGVLPLVQETMVLLWDRMAGPTLSLEAYEELGDGGRSGLAVAVTSRADAVLADLLPEQRSIARRIFLRLIQFGEGRPDTRRQQPRSALLSAGEDMHLFEQTLHHLTNSRLLTISSEERDTSRKVDIAHEALIGSWPTLQQWCAEWREAEQIRRRLDARVVEWVRRGQGSVGLLDEPELSEARYWLSSPEGGVLGYDEALPTLVELSLHQKKQMTELQEQFSIVQGDHELMTAMFASMPEGMMLIEADGRVIFANDALFQFCGMDQQAIRNVTVEQFLDVWRQTANYSVSEWGELARGINAILQGHATLTSGILAKGASDAQAIEWSAQLTLQHKGNLGRALLILRDVTDTKAAEQRLQKYTGILVHDMRAPLTAITSGIEMIQRGLGGPVTDRQQELLKIVHQNSRTLLELINTLIDFSKEEAGRV